ncbi:MAG: DUF3500 domain-containing protein [Pseudomonadota bacterium]
MKLTSIASLAAIIGTLPTTAAVAHSGGYNSHGAALLASCAPSAPGHTPEAMAMVANDFLNVLTEEQRRLAHYELDSPERYEWTNVPVRGDVGGLQLGDLEAEQMNGFCDLMASLLSGYGFEKIRSIMQGDDLRSIIDGEPNTGVGVEAFRVSLFGDPSDTSRWAVQLDGHHIALNFTLEGDHYSMSPSFIGTYPKEFTVAGTKFTPMAGEVDLAFQFLDSLTEPQRSDAVISSTRGEIQTGPGNDGFVPIQKGLKAATLNSTQTGLLLSLASQWLDIMPPPHARRAQERFLSSIDSTTISWSGSTERGKDISYRIQGPSIIIEFANDKRGGAAEGGDPTNHIHTMYRDIENDYGQGW